MHRVSMPMSVRVQPAQFLACSEKSHLEVNWLHSIAAVLIPSDCIILLSGTKAESSEQAEVLLTCRSAHAERVLGFVLQQCACRGG